MSNTAVLKANIMSSLDVLPATSLEALAEFTSFLRAKSRQEDKPRVVKLRGLWNQTPPITEGDIAEARREVWGSFGDRDI
jgi:hypothetical protein